ncbi:family 43 glycosylhydrolase [Paenibacillus wynnii]|uniref:glycoside hydrolase family 43 protein n=1 Tax=Paenibacillus wynnii TaxID=268407 RepID=UPI0009FD54F9|nr:glycoside hydrolase family 43 protein [Paenibacillus wynnii]
MRSFASKSLLLILILSLLGCTEESEGKKSTLNSNASVAAGQSDFRNPIVEQRADPWVYLHSDGYYYFTGSVPEYDRIELRRAKTLNELEQAETADVWTKQESGPGSKHIWAPEIHFYKGKWYIYFAAAREDAPFDHRIYVLENDAANPLEGTWIEKGQLKTNWESFSLDATTFEFNDILYLVWAQKAFDIEGNSNLYIAELENPWTLKGQQTLLSKPDQPWERIGFKVNEGAAVIKHKDKVFITYSGSATDDNYAMGLLTASDSSNLLNPKSWTKSEAPIFFSNPETGRYGPGHNSFTTTPDGKKDILIYHARPYKDIQGDPLFDANRHAWAQFFTWDDNGIPNLGRPGVEK